MALSLTVAKVICLVVLIILTLAFSAIPYFLVLRGSRSLVSTRWKNSLIAYLNCFAGGVFLGTLLLHLLIEGSEEFDEYKTKVNWETDFPFFNTFVAGGFFLVALIELVMHSCLHREHKHSTKDIYISPDGEQRVTDVNQSQGLYGAMGNYRRIADPEPPNVVGSNGEVMTNPETEGILPTKRELESGPPVIGNKQSQLNEGSPLGVKSDNAAICDEAAEVPILRAFLLLVALSFHTIFDGLAVGLQQDTSEVWQVFMAISIHKSIIAFCLGFEFFSSHATAPGKAFLWLCLFSLMSPIGIGLGIYLTSGGVNELAKLLSSGILQGLASGTFLYVTFLEILCLHIGHHCRGKFIHVFFAMLGFGAMAGVKALDHD